MKLLSRLAALGAVLVISGTAAMAQETWNVSYGGIGSAFWVSTSNGTEDAGGIVITKNSHVAGPVSAVTAPSSFMAYCVDITSAIGVPGGPVNALAWYDPTIPAMQPPSITWAKAGELSYLYNQYGWSAPQNSSQAAEVQLAMWKILYGAAFTFVNTGVVTNAAVASLVAEAAGKTDHNVYFIKRTPVGNTPGQMFIGGKGQPHEQLTPEASSLLLLLPGILPLGLMLRKRSRA